ncbi:mercuric reductase [Rhizobium sp. 2YAF20]|uniref:mercuric reductase n=1 Tax=Rhizobium sp. 2YAF20 TaxID=3233027 RepID=UPI003F9E8F7D
MTRKDQSDPNGSRDGQLRSRLLDNVRPPTWQNPTNASKYNLVVLGAGPGGITAARQAAALGAKVALIERKFIGGVSLNVGCVPSKAIIRTARLYAEMSAAEILGAQVPANVVVDFAAIMERMRRLRIRLSQADSAQRLSEAGIDVYFGEASFTAPNTVEVAGETLRFKKALIATGARPLVQPLPGLDDVGFLTNENVFNLTECPRRLLVMGGGPLGCELAQAFCRFGSHVIIVQNDPMFLPKEERDAAHILSDALARDGVDVRLNTAVVGVQLDGAEKVVELVSAGEKSSVPVDEILVATGRTPNVENLNLEVANVQFDTKNGIFVNDFLQTSNRKIYAAGDVCMEHKFTHAAEASAGTAVTNALVFGRRRLSKLQIPWCTYTDPEIAHVGLYVAEARARGIPVTTYTILMHDVDRAVTDGEEDGFVKIHVKQGTDRILGAAVVARHGGEMIDGVSLAITSGIGLRALAKVIHTYPTQTMAIKMAADAFDRARRTSLLKFLSRGWLWLQRRISYGDRR